MEERKYTVAQVAKILNCSKSQVRYLLLTGQLRGFKIKKKNSKGSWRIYESSVLEYLIENDNFVEILGISDFSHLDEKILLQKLKNKLFRLASSR
ncbi:helix-turn-helix domain-containing protein [Desulfurobacterium thermolithotrophum]|uniref:helix-turn-helix domain-containing protein n=1 Tax=Desulfurobacterium thermolithotrophum TaxID=64160 RepID=UPI0039848E8A